MRNALVLLAMLAAPAWADGDVARGKELFVTCAGCHNVEKDQPNRAPSLRTLFGKVTLRNGQRANDENVRAIVLDGNNGMPAFRFSFRPSEIDDLMAYLHTLTGRPAAAEGEGAQYFKAYCQRCHNPESRTATGPDLRGRYSEAWPRLIDGGHAGAPPLREWLDNAGREALVGFLKSY